MMRAKNFSWLWISCVCVFAGCAGTGELVKQRSVSLRQDVFREVQGKTPIPYGYAELRIFFSVKTHTSSFYVLESGAHGTPDYVLVLNIDGQAEKIKGAMTEENTLDERPRTPETGNGIRYRFRKDLRLAAGNHNVFIAVPEDEVAAEVEIRLEVGTRNELVLEPVYATGKRFGKMTPNFYSHLSGIRLLLNGKLI
jgi:hypothetical protein